MCSESGRIPLSQFIKNSALRHNQAISAPSTPELHIRRQYSQSFRSTEKSSALLHQHTKQNMFSFTWRVSADFPKVRHLLRRSASAQRAAEGEAGCPSDAVWLISWCERQSTLPCVLTSPAPRIAAPSTLPHLISAPPAGTDQRRFQSSARHLTDSNLDHRRKDSPASPVHIRTPASLI